MTWVQTRATIFMAYLLISRKLALFLIIIGCSFSLQAQPLVHQKVYDWFLEERFLITDQNDDALLDRQEMQQFPEEFAYFLVERHYTLTDLNRDGRLSFNELNQRTLTEFRYRYNMELRQLRALKQQYPALDEGDPAYLKQRPELLASLFGNFTWMVEHKALCQAIYEDEAWTREQPEVLLALHRNLRWMTANPSAARKLYDDRSATRRLPELLAWRADHKAFIRRTTLSNDFFGNVFFPSDVKINLDR